MTTVQFFPETPDDVDGVFELWPAVARDVGIVIREALGAGRPKHVPVTVHQFGETLLRAVEHRPDRGWIAIDYPDDPIGEELLYVGGDLFAAAFTAVVGRPPREREQATPRRVFEALQVRGLS